MRIVNTGNIYRLYDNSMTIGEQLPAQTYIVRFSKQSGFFLERYNDFEITEKVYGVHMQKVDKVFNSFKIFERNLGVILSGDKGIGKSLFAKMLALKACENDYPLIVVNEYIPGIADFLNEIEQEVVILFDEFDKTFASCSHGEDAQASLLTLFDGFCMGKKLFIVTCNTLNRLNDYLINRPGRFHYHFRFEYPTAEEIKIYLEDKLEEKYWGEIDDVVDFSLKTNINYDCLRAIAFELSTGLSFKEAIKDLNILHLCTEVRCAVTVTLTNGMVLNCLESIDFFSNKKYYCEFDYEEYYDAFTVSFNPSDAVYNYTTGKSVIEGSQVELNVEPGLKTCQDKEIYETLKDFQVERIEIKRMPTTPLHYNLS